MRNQNFTRKSLPNTKNNMMSDSLPG